jgi:hypothetical protein
MDSCFSELGVKLRTEDRWSNKGPALYIEDIIDDATDTVNQYCEWRYYPEDMALNRWVRRRASWIASYLLSQRRGNPKQFVTQYKQIMEDLGRVFEAKLQIPRLSLRAYFRPEYHNLVVEDRNRDALPGGPHRMGWFYWVGY